MSINILESETTIRLSIFAGFFITLAIVEYYFPRIATKNSRLRRWSSNIGLSFFNSILAKTLVPIAGVSAALWAASNEVGLFQFIALPSWLLTILFLLIFDLVIYWQHRLFHKLPMLWRLHRVHHTDLDYDLTTGSRFHPFEIVLSALIKVCLIIVLGPSAIAVLLAEVVLNASAMFTHSNIRLPLGLDKALRLIFVTPDMHRIHHSVIKAEHNSNYGFNLSCWDHIFSSYTAEPKHGYEGMDIGIRSFQDKSSINFFSLLLQPFRKAQSAKAKT